MANTTIKTMWIIMIAISYEEDILGSTRATTTTTTTTITNRITTLEGKEGSDQWVAIIIHINTATSDQRVLMQGITTHTQNPNCKDLLEIALMETIPIGLQALSHLDLPIMEDFHLHVERGGKVIRSKESKMIKGAWLKGHIDAVIWLNMLSQ
jgi:hypothetical protein